MSSTGTGAPRPFPRVPAHAWTWFQRSRPVVAETAKRLTGAAPGPEFVDEIREAFDEDAFTREVVIGVVADVAFNGRAPRRRPAGVSWDRGLTWWAAALAGTTPTEFEARSTAPEPAQHQLFAGETAEPARRQKGRRGPTPERLALARTLRELVEAADGGQVPVQALRQLIDQLEAG